MENPVPLVRLIIAGLALLLVGCAAHELQTVQPQGRRADRIASLRDGETTRSEVLSQWGEPSTLFEDERILSYRLNGGYAVVRPREGRKGKPPEPRPARWEGVRYDLVLVFDSDGVLERHRLLRIR